MGLKNRVVREIGRKSTVFDWGGGGGRGTTFGLSSLEV